MDKIEERDIQGENRSLGLPRRIRTTYSEFAVTLLDADVCSPQTIVSSGLRQPERDDLR
jgi:hypothetical protein